MESLMNYIYEYDPCCIDDFLTDNLNNIENLSPYEQLCLLRSCYVYGNFMELVPKYLIELIKKYGVPEQWKKEVNNIIPAKNIIIYRGVNKYNTETGSSYTLNIDVAENFSKLCGSSGYIIEKCISKKDIIFYTNDRMEDEVFIKI